VVQEILAFFSYAIEVVHRDVHSDVMSYVWNIFLRVAFNKGTTWHQEISVLAACGSIRGLFSREQENSYVRVEFVVDRLQVGVQVDQLMVTRVFAFHIIMLTMILTTFRAIRFSDLFLEWPEYLYYAPLPVDHDIILTEIIRWLDLFRALSFQSKAPMYRRRVIASPLMLAVLILTCSKVPICAAMGFGVIVGLLQMNLPIATIPRYMLAEVRSIPLLAIPFFILAANVLEEMNIIRRIFDFINHLISRIPGGLAQVTIVTEMVLPVSPALRFQILPLGYITIKAMERPYRRNFAAALVGAASILGPIILPSIMSYRLRSPHGRLIATLYLRAGARLAIGGLLMLTVFIFAKTGREKCPPTRRSTFREIARSGFIGAPAIVTPVIILYGMTGGSITPTEGGVVAIVYSLFLALSIGSSRSIDSIKPLLSPSG
jgi:hypothetical protein